MDKQSENFKNTMKRLNFSIEQTSFDFTNPKYSGCVDVLAHNNNIKSVVNNKKRIIISLQTTTLINDNVDENGWDDEAIGQKDNLLLKAIHYKMLANYEWGIEDIPFYYMVFSTKNDWEYKVFKINVDVSTYKHHYSNLLNIKEYLDAQIKIGWQGKPTLI